MTKIYLLINNIIVVSTIIVICAISWCNAIISDKRLCFDPNCSVPVALARTTMLYNSIEPHILSFPANAEVKIFSKEAGRRLDLWGAEVLGKRGYIPKRFVRETRRLKSNLTYEVPTEFPLIDVDKSGPVEVEVDISNQPEVSQDQKVELNKTEDEPQALKDGENRSTDAPPDTEKLKGKKDESNGSKNAVTPEPEKSSIDSSSAAQPPDPQAREQFVDKTAEQIREGLKNVSPSYEVIDGTTISLIAEDVSIKPSHPTQGIVATAVPDEEPILSVHPSMPAIDRPMLATFSKVNTQTFETLMHSNIPTENLPSQTDSSTQFPPTQHKENDSPMSEPDMSQESQVEDDSKAKITHDQSSTGDIEPTENVETNVPKSKVPVTNNENNNLEFSDNPIKPPVDANNSREELSSPDGATSSSSNDTQKDELDAAENMVDNSEELKILSDEKSLSDINGSSDSIKENENNLNSSEAASDYGKGDREELVSKNSSPEIKQNQSELDGSIPKEEFQDSGERTEHLPDGKITDTAKEINGSNNIAETTATSENKVTTSEGTVEQNDNQVTQNDVTIKEHNKNNNVYNVDDASVENVDEDNSQDEYDSEESTEEDYPNDYANLSGEEMFTEAYSDLQEEQFTTSRDLPMVEDKSQVDNDQLNTDLFGVNESDSSEVQFSQEHGNEATTENNVFQETKVFDTDEQVTESELYTEEPSIHVAPPAEVCDTISDCADLDNSRVLSDVEQETIEGDDESFYSSFERHNYLETLLYVSVTAITTLLFSLGYYYIENQRRDQELVGKINVLEKDLLVTTKESMMLSESLKAAKTKLDSIEDESFGSNEMVLSLKSELDAAQVNKGELEDQIITLEKELESATEAGLELERMLREFLSSQSDENPLAQSVEDLQTRLNAQQATNESLTNSFNLKSQENETLTSELAVTRQKCQEFEVEVARIAGELQVLSSRKNSIENEYSAKIGKLNKQISKLSAERSDLINQLRTKEMALNDLAEISQKQNIDGLDFEKLYEVSQIKAELQLVTEERDELKSKITEVEGAHQLLEEHMKLIKEEIASVTKQYELAERDKTEAQTRLEVLSNYFKEKESQLQKELGMQEALWVQKQGEVTSTVDRIQTMQNEIQNYRQQIETLKREILDQEREYKSQISALETKSHEQWVIARQSERRLEESKAEAGQLRNRLTMVEKSINEVDPDSKLHRLETNGETASSPQLFMGAESSSSPIIFSGSSGVPPLPPSYLYGGPLPPPFIPPPPHSGSGPMYDISRRPPPLGGRLSSPPPMPLHHPPGRYEDAISPPPPLSPPLHPPYNSFRSPPPLPPFGNEHIHPHPPPPFLPPLGTSNSWGDEPLPPLRNPVFHPHQREQRLRNHKGSLHSSGDSLDKSNHTGKT